MTSTDSLPEIAQAQDRRPILLPALGRNRNGVVPLALHNSDYVPEVEIKNDGFLHRHFASGIPTNTGMFRDDYHSRRSHRDGVPGSPGVARVVA
eukprot:CAMPEP_0172537080 /NCGR_PEP_ID=MMETSP1067-20121228/8762_1 /TAXON_ID=265564 ORGANISM="Thalassiosira punctigera, Strain Tpunct2005C2" /NCGR_SAMPLE_ID=MMETSP1067 /ASSEMBLY_ACC=CAM_ASM_000444 /LENGTH=93 /DNA_ID=CAMNT_0013322307 /DNA_START=31 /DNA_END=309 /DNA_ORIENTATION=-